MTQEERNKIIDGIIEDMAWSNTRRLQLVGKIHKDGREYDSQESLDQFRCFLYSELIYMTDNVIISHKHNWEFLYNNWAIFISRFYGITQTWEEFKDSGTYKEYSCRTT